MKSPIIIATWLILAAVTAKGQDSGQFKRVPYKLTVAVDKKSVYVEDIRATPYVLPDNTIQLYPGEKVFLEMEQENGFITSVTAVRKITNPEKTVTISFTQSSKKRVHELMILEIQNPFSQDLLYSSKIYLLKQKRWVDTNVYPVLGKLAAFETWPDIITSIVLGDWKFKTN